jgi:hypothetical protein
MEIEGFVLEAGLDLGFGGLGLEGQAEKQDGKGDPEACLERHGSTIRMVRGGPQRESRRSVGRREFVRWTAADGVSRCCVGRR